MQARTTKYIAAVREYVQQHGHATNKDVWLALQHDFPEVSATTVHRITARLAERRELAMAPTAQDHAARFDANTAPHDHFNCTHCGRLRDITVPRECIEAVQAQLGNCQISGSLTIQGVCSVCLGNNKETKEET